MRISGVILLTVLASNLAGAECPSLPELDYPVVEALVPGDTGAVAAQWQPMPESASAGVCEVSGRRVLKFPCDFAKVDVQRAGWDSPTSLDLSHCQGLTFRAYCPNPKPVSYFAFYLKSGSGWYSFSYGLGEKGEWTTVTLEKQNAHIEGDPTGWSKIDGLRVSAWCGTRENTELYLADIGLLGEDSPIAIVRNESLSGKSNAMRAVEECCQRVKGAFDRVGVPTVLVSDRELPLGCLFGREVVILPYNPEMPAESVTALLKFVSEGGRLVAFYTIPSALFSGMDIEGGSYKKADGGLTFSSIRPTAEPLTGQPDSVVQSSWNIQEAKAIPGKSKVVAEWFNAEGQDTGLAAVVASSKGVYMTHILLSEAGSAGDRLMLSMVGHLWPDAWKQAAEGSLRQAEKLGAWNGFDAVCAEVTRLAGADPRPGEWLAKAKAARDKVNAMIGEGHCPEAVTASGEVREALLHAYCSAQKPAAGEHRAYWCHSAFGVDGLTWDEAIQTLAENGFTAILPNMLWGGSAFYESTVLPVAPDVKEKGDQIAACVAACRKYGVACHVWKVNWNMGWTAPAEFLERMKADGRIQVGFDGKEEARWLCPSHPDNQQLEIDAMVEVATKYDVDGIHFDYIRYPDQDHCFCAGCRGRFEAAIGRKVVNWPGDVRSDKELDQKWQDFRREQITRVVAAVHERVTKEKPQVKISAAVFPNWINDRDTVGQDWKLWCEKGYLDFVCPMDYTASNEDFEQRVRRQIEWAGKVPCYPGIGQSVWPDPGDMVKLIDQILITRKLGTGGFTVFNYAVNEAKRMVPLCGEGVTRK